MFLKHTEWNDVLEARVIELWPTHSDTQIAKSLAKEFNTHFTRNAIIGKRFRMGIGADKKAPVDPTTVKPKRTSPRIRRDRPVLKVVEGGLGFRRFIRPVESKETILLKCAEVVPLNKGLLELSEFECRYPYGDADFTFCGHPTQEDSSWCPAHFALCLVPPKTNTDKAPKRLGTDFGKRVFG